MCQNIYIASNRELPEIPWNENSPGFYVLEVNQEGILKMLRPILKEKKFYEALSFMGCACGLSYGDWSREDEREDHEQRMKDVQGFLKYLRDQSIGNELRVFSTSWDEFPDSYESKDWVLSTMVGDEFEVEELTIFSVKGLT